MKSLLSSHTGHTPWRVSDENINDGFPALLVLFATSGRSQSVSLTRIYTDTHGAVHVHNGYRDLLQIERDGTIIVHTEKAKVTLGIDGKAKGEGDVQLDQMSTNFYAAIETFMVAAGRRPCLIK